MIISQSFLLFQCFILYHMSLFLSLMSFLLYQLGLWRKLHWQKMPIYWQCQHSWTYIDRTCSKHENEKDNYHSSRLFTFYQKISTIWKKTQDLVCSHVTVLPVYAYDFCLARLAYIIVTAYKFVWKLLQFLDLWLLHRKIIHL